MKLGTHVLPAVGVMLRGRWIPSLPGLHQRQALTPERELGQLVREKRKEFEPCHRPDLNREVHRGRLGPGDMPPARWNVEPSPSFQSRGQAYPRRFALVGE